MKANLPKLELDQYNGEKSNIALSPQASEGVWGGWFIAGSLVIVIHLLLILRDSVDIIKVHTEAMANKMVTSDNKSPATIEMHDFGTETISGITSHSKLAVMKEHRLRNMRTFFQQVGVYLIFSL